MMLTARWKKAAAAAMLAGAAAAPLQAQTPGHMELLVNEADAEGDFGVLGGYTYDPAQNVFWTVLFGGGAGVRRIEPGFGSTQYVYPTNVAQFIRASDVAGGVTNADFSGTPIQSGILLNPKPITIDYGNEADQYGNPIGEVTYQPGQLAFISDALPRVQDGDGNYRFDLTKRLYRYDLRPIGASQPTGVGVPDRDNAQDGAGNIIGSYNHVDWNDPFSVLVTEENLRDASGHSQTVASGSNFGRQFTWSSDGQSLYTVDSGTNTGGIYKVGAADGSLTRLYVEEGGGNVIGEPAVLDSAVRQFGAGTGDQVLFDGTSQNGNAGGISYILDDGTDEPATPQVALAGSQLLDFTGNSSGSVRSIATDSAGNIYFYESGSGALFQYDTQGRLVSLVNKIQRASFNEAQNGDGTYRDAGGMLRLQVYEDEDNGTRVFYRGNNTFVAGVSVGQAGDFDGNAQIDAADTGFFIQQFQRQDLPTAGTQAYLDYAAADLNGSGDVVGFAREGDPYSSYDGTLTGKAVDNADLDALRQFVNLRPGDADWNFKVDIGDFNTLKSNFNPTITDATFFDGNFDYHVNGNVDIADFQALKANFDPVNAYSTDPEAETSMSLASFSSTAAGELTLRVNVVDGMVHLLGDQVTFDAVQITGSGESILGENYLGIDGLDDILGDAFIAGLTLGDGVTLDGELALGQIYNAALDARDWTFLYNDSVAGTISYVPEPSSLILLGLGGPALLVRRRRA